MDDWMNRTLSQMVGRDTGLVENDTGLVGRDTRIYAGTLGQDQRYWDC